MSIEEILQRVKAFAETAHGEQRRKFADEKYIEHPVRVMETCRRFNPSLPMLSAALLHDVLEDTSVDEHQMNEFLLSVMNREDALRTQQLVIELTDIYTKANYPRMNRKKRKIKEAERLANTSAETQTIKYADIMDNCQDLGAGDLDFAPVFLKECKRLLEAMTKGNGELHKEASLLVDNELERINRP